MSATVEFLLEKLFNEKKISKCILDEAQKIRVQLIITVKKKTDLLFYCIYQAHKSLNIVTTHLEIANLVNLSPNDPQKLQKEVRLAIKKFCEIKTGYRPVHRDWTVRDMIIFYYAKLEDRNFVDEFDSLDSLLIFYEKVMIRLKRNECTILSKNPHLIALAIIQYYYDDNDQKNHCSKINWENLFFIRQKTQVELQKKIEIGLKQ